MGKHDLRTAAARFAAVCKHLEIGLTLQRERIMQRSATAPRVQCGPYEIENLVGQPGNDLDYYVYELARLRHTAEAVVKVWSRASGAVPSAVKEALVTFDAEIPSLKEVRDPLTHPNNDDKLDSIARSSSMIRLQPNGRVEYLVDPEGRQHVVALTLARAIIALCDQTLADCPKAPLV